jgi:hypothetical protein
LNFFPAISWGLCTGTKGEKMVIFGFSTGTKSEFRIFEEKNFNFSLLLPVLNPKITTFRPLVPVQSPQEKIQKNFFFGYLYRSKYLTFGPKKFLKNFLAAFGTWYYLQKNFLKTKVVPCTKYGVFWFFS